MNRVLVILTGLSILAHAIFGCCNHAFAGKANTRSSCCCHRATRTSAPAKVSGKSDSKALSKIAFSRSQSDPTNTHECKHASCHWLANGKVNHAQIALDLTADFSAPLVASLARPWTSQVTTSFDVADRDAPPLRLHLTLGVLLV